jgi:carboxypeptidase Taq
MPSYKDFEEHIAGYNDLLNAISILKWDARTQMPSGGAQTRGHQLATLSRIAQDYFISDKTARLLEAAESEVAGEDPDSYRVRGVQHTRKWYEILKRIPASLLSEKATLAAVTEQAWAEAKKNNDFASFAPYLEKTVVLVRALADAIGYQEHPFDALILEYEPSMTAARLRPLFTDLKAGLMPLLGNIIENDKPLEKDLWAQDYPQDKQKAFGLEIAQKFGYDLNRGKLDIAPHPFEISFTREDVRITTRYHNNYLPMALFATLHETGHALYEQGIDPKLTRSALTCDFLAQESVGGSSSGTHESQSRLWENQIGRSRAMWQVHLPRLREFFPEQLAGVDVDLFYRSVNRVRPSLIRVEADEVTYNLHIMLRTEIELELLVGKLKVNDLPEIWNAKMQEYLGITPPNDSQGVLQDVHWSSGGFAAFPGYTIGNVMAAQFFEAAHRDIPGLDDALARGEYVPLRDWLTQNIYRHGHAFSADELLKRTTGNSLQVRPYLGYLERKYSELYGIDGTSQS